MKNLSSLARCFLLCTALFAPQAGAQIASLSTVSFRLDTAVGGVVSTSATVGAAAVGSAVAGTICGSLSVGAVGINASQPCNPATTLGTRAVQTIATITGMVFTQNFTSADLTSTAAALSAAGLPNNMFYFVIQTSSPPAAKGAPPVAPPQFLALQVRLFNLPGTLSKVSPTLADVASTGNSSVAIRYTLAAADTPLGGQFCTSLIGAYPPNGVSNGNPCAASLGYTNSVVSYAPNSLQANENLNIPQSVARQAYQAAQASGNSIFYFVRQFASGKYGVVQLRLSGNAANAPLTLTEVKLAFRPSNQPIAQVQHGQAVPRFGAQIRYRGAGLLRARWEIVAPGDRLPSSLDLSTEASLSPNDRALQQRYPLLQAFQIYLQPNGTANIPGPDPKLLPSDLDGQYQILLRIEATDALQPLDGTGQLASASSAPFVLPVLRYLVGMAGKPATSGSQSITPIALLASTAAHFQWQPIAGVQFYRLEIEENGSLIFAARVREQNGDASYTLPPFVLSASDKPPVRWRVVGLAEGGQLVGKSDWREISP